MLREGCHTVVRRSLENTPELTQLFCGAPLPMTFKLTHLKLFDNIQIILAAPVASPDYVT